MDARRTLTLLVLFLGLALLAGCAPEGWPREAAAAPTPAEPTAAPTGEKPPYPPPPTVTPAPTDSDTGYPVYPTPTGLPSRTPTPTRTPVVTPTEIPFPTPLPTPVVTPVPVAEPPFIPEAAGQAPEVFTLVYREGDAVRAVASDGTGERVLLDVAERHGLRLATRADGVFRWQQGGPSPDGRTLALVTAEHDIQLFDLETGETRLLVEGAVEPVWSPDGTRLAYRDWANGGLWVAEVVTGETRELYAVEQPEGGGRYVTHLAWSPDGMRICFVDELVFQTSALVVVAVDGTEPPGMLVAPSMHAVSWPEWSPRGDRVVFILEGGELSPSGEHPSLWVINSDGTSLTQLTRDMLAWAPKWSPDGEWIAFCGFIPYEEGYSHWDVWLMHFDKRDLKRLTATAEIGETSLAWSPNGLALVVRGADDAGVTGIWPLSLVDGSRSLLIPDTDLDSWLHTLRP